MRKSLLTMCLAFMAASVFAIPAQKGIYKTIRLADGTELRAELRGDEHFHFYETSDGLRYTEQADGTYALLDAQATQQRLNARQARIAAKTGEVRTQPMRLINTSQPAAGQGFFGEKKGLVILVQFADLDFRSYHDNAFYDKMTNQKNYTEGQFRGSVNDYFYDQSNGQFDLSFDVVGPITAPQDYEYYGKNNGYGSDARVGELVAWACNEIDDQVNFADYDWDGDGNVDQVFVLYAGQGEHNGGGEDAIWPHMFYLSQSDYGKTLQLDGVKIDTYACSCELNSNNQADGIGAFCHEFSHCLGFADHYDTYNGGGYGTSDWDLLCSGNYNGNSFCPAGYTAYEKWFAGWTIPTELKNDTVVSSISPLSENGETYVIYNERNHNEYYLVENRQQTNWDTSLPGAGLLITHVDFNKSSWMNNTINTSTSHQRLTVFHADNSSSFWHDVANDAYPYNRNDSLTENSKPANSVFRRNIDGTYYMGKSLLNIKRKVDGTMSFTFRGMKKEDETAIADVKAADSANAADHRIYTIGGTYVGTDFNVLPKGIYIVGGRKVVK